MRINDCSSDVCSSDLPMAGAFRRSAAASTATVYVVDDDEAVRRSLDWLISSVNLPVRTFASARAFLESYRSGEEGCVVVDVRMPGMSGLELQRKLAKAASHLPIIIITGHGDIDRKSTRLNSSH